MFIWGWTMYIAHPYVHHSQHDFGFSVLTIVQQFCLINSSNVSENRNYTWYYTFLLTAIASKKSVICGHKSRQCGSIVSLEAQLLMYTWRPFKEGWTRIVQDTMAIRRTWKERHRDKNSGRTAPLTVQREYDLHCSVRSRGRRNRRHGRASS